MFRLHRSQFLRPRERLYELLALQEAARGGIFPEGPTDSVFDRRTIVGYLTDLEGRGLLAGTGESAPRRLRLTDAGRRRLHYLLVDYVRELATLNESARQILRRSLAELSLAGVRRVAFYPHGETAEVTFAVLESLGVELVAIVDDSPLKWDTPFHHLRVRPSADLAVVRPEAVIVTTSAFEEQIVARITAMQLGGVRIHTL
jgi:hypothetical protein